MKARYLYDMDGDRCREFPDGRRPVGSVVEHPDAYKLVRIGCCEAADDECRERADMTPEKTRLAQFYYLRRRRGIHPDDHEAYAAGLMIGYDANDEPIPGPNYFDPEAVEERSGMDLSMMGACDHE